MIGLDKILKEIQDEANIIENKILSDAQAQADEILAAAKQTAKEQADKINEKAEQTYIDIIKRGESASELEAKKRTLLKKQELINETIELAYNKLCNLSNTEYFDIILKMINKFALDKDGEILFSEKDKKNMPLDFASKINEVVSTKGAKLTIGEKSANIDGGFILTYGGIEENCTFKALFESRAEELSDKVHALLFE